MASAILSNMTTTETPRKQSTADRVRENRLRRMAARQGLRLVKSHRRDPRALDFGEYMILDVDTRGIILGDRNRGYGCDLDEVERYITEGGA